MKVFISLHLITLLMSTVVTFAQESYIVTAKSGLTIRKEPKPRAQKLGKLPYNTVVDVIERTDFILTITDEGKQLQGSWVKVYFGTNPEVNSEDKTGFVFDGYLQKVAKHNISGTTSVDQKLEIYKIRPLPKTTNEKVGFISLTDGYLFKDEGTSTLIAKEYLDERQPKNINYHKLDDKRRTKFLKSLGIRETDSLFIYQFLSDAITTSLISAIPVVARVSPYSIEKSLQQSDYMIGLEIGKNLFDINKNKNVSSTSLAYIGTKNPFVKGQLRPVLWHEVAAGSFPKTPDVFDSTQIKEKSPKNTFEFSTKDLRYFLQNRLRNGKIYGRHFKVLALEYDTLVFDKTFASEQGEALLSLNTVLDKKRHLRIGIWTGKLFKDKPPIITDFISHYSGCPTIYFLDKTQSSIKIRCDNRR